MHIRMQLNLVIKTYFILGYLWIGSSLLVLGQTFPAGFSRVLVANGITQPTALAFSPDGRIFICQQTGNVRVVKNNVLLTTPFISIAVNSLTERGLLGIAF